MLARDGRAPALQFEHAICVSAATRDVLVEQGVPVAHARIIHTGLDAQPYLEAECPQRSSNGQQSLRLLYAGRLAPTKGLETAIEALRLLAGRSRKAITLAIAGSGDTAYVSQLRGLVEEAGLAEKVTFLGRVPSSEMPGLMRCFDILLVPSIWPEPFARVVLEGMISGLTIVASAIGGTPEIVRDGENGLLFAPEDAAALAEKIAGLAADPLLQARLAGTGQAMVQNEFTLSKMLDQMESVLLEAAAAYQGEPGQAPESGA
jgi:glycosyltransferase involved in cell wall biosynthesis